MMSYDEDDDEESEGLYANGHWAWDEKRNELKFLSDITTTLSTTTAGYVPAAIVGPVEFKEDLDVVEQQRFKKRMQRKAEGPNDVVRLQDVKDIVLYCAPAVLLSRNIINVLHTATTERFLRALILYCQYYLQISDIMEQRTLELQTKIPTLSSKAVESIYQENLDDLRMVVAKEYCTMIIGGDDFKRFHHMGKEKKAKSLTRKEAFIFEPLIRISSQIVWVALARRNYTHIELEINRLFRSKKFNLVEHNLKKDVELEMTPGQRRVLRGICLKFGSAIHQHSPLFDELLCNSNLDFRMLGLGVIKYKKLNERLRFLESVLTKPETEFPDLNINLGIIGLRRDRFDPMLRGIQAPPTTTDESTTAKSLSKRMSKISTSSKKSVTSTTNQSTVHIIKRSYPPVSLPEKTIEPQPEDFPDENRPRLVIDSTQHRRWLIRITRRFARRQTNTMNSFPQSGGARPLSNIVKRSNKTGLNLEQPFRQ